VQKLRNYNLHYMLPLTQAQLSLDPKERTPHQFLLSKERLLRWSEWGPTARRFLDEQPDTFPIMPVLKEYVDVMNTFHRWREARETEMFNRGMTAQHGPGSKVARKYGAETMNDDSSSSSDRM
jgi:hypothetical protein